MAAPPPWCPPGSPSCPSSGRSPTRRAGRSPSACLPLPPSRVCHTAKTSRLNSDKGRKHLPPSLPSTSEHLSGLKHIYPQSFGEGGSEGEVTDELINKHLSNTPLSTQATGSPLHESTACAHCSTGLEPHLIHLLFTNCSCRTMLTTINESFTLRNP